MYILLLLEFKKYYILLKNNGGLLIILLLFTIFLLIFILKHPINTQIKINNFVNIPLIPYSLSIMDEFIEEYGNI